MIMGNPAGVRRVQKQKRTKRDMKRIIAKMMSAQAPEAAKTAPAPKK
jgi:hypothetical protein